MPSTKEIKILQAAGISDRRRCGKSTAIRSRRNGWHQWYRLRARSAERFDRNDQKVAELRDEGIKKMKFAKEQLTLTSNGNRVSYHNITQEVKDFVERSQIKNGICLVQSPHTTCSVIFEEFMHDTDFNGDEFLQVDLNRILDKLVPRELSENTNYRYPGPKHFGISDEPR